MAMHICFVGGLNVIVDSYMPLQVIIIQMLQQCSCFPGTAFAHQVTKHQLRSNGLYLCLMSSHLCAH